MCFIHQCIPNTRTVPSTQWVLSPVSQMDKSYFSRKCLVCLRVSSVAGCRRRRALVSSWIDDFYPHKAHALHTLGLLFRLGFHPHLDPGLKASQVKTLFWSHHFSAQILRWLPTTVEIQHIFAPLVIEALGLPPTSPSKLKLYSVPKGALGCISVALLNGFQIFLSNLSVVIPFFMLFPLFETTVPTEWCSWGLLKAVRDSSACWNHLELSSPSFTPFCLYYL